MPSSSEVTPAVIDDHPEAYEQIHVHTVYDQIASHFSSTRYKVANLILLLTATLTTIALAPHLKIFAGYTRRMGRA
jgi:tRNA (uracil-5-)-methyltransferase TRM9